MVNTVLLPALVNHNRSQILFQQDGAIAHTARQSMAVLRHAFRGQVISRYGDVNCPARSLYLTTPDLILWVSEEPSLCHTPSNIGRP